MRNASVSNLLNRPRFSSIRRKVDRMKAMFHAALIVGAIALPLAVLAPGASEAETPKTASVEAVILVG
jgi:hypothetical protein